MVQKLACCCCYRKVCADCRCKCYRRAVCLFAVSLWEVGKQGWLLLRNSGLVGDRLHTQHVM